MSHYPYIYEYIYKLTYFIKQNLKRLLNICFSLCILVIISSQNNYLWYIPFPQKFSSWIWRQWSGTLWLHFTQLINSSDRASRANALVLLIWLLHRGHSLIRFWHLEHIACPVEHWRIGGFMVSKQTGHFKKLRSLWLCIALSA